MTTAAITEILGNNPADFVTPEITRMSPEGEWLGAVRDVLRWKGLLAACWAKSVE